MKILRKHELYLQAQNPPLKTSIKLMFSKKATKIEKIFTVDLTVTTYCQIDAEDFVNFCGLLRKRELYLLLEVKTITKIAESVKH